MNSVVGWNHVRALDNLHRHMASFLDWNPARSPQASLAPQDQSINAAEWAPLVDIAENDKEYLIKIELTEVQKQDVKVTVEDGTLTISGERKADNEEKAWKFHRLERNYGRFERIFSLPEDIDGNKVKAEFRNGMLRVHLAKSEKSRAKEIEVNIG
jgi:HSP20 family protein